MKRLFRKNQIIITSLAIMIVIAGYLNFTADQTKPVKQEAAAETAEKIREENIQAEEAAAGARQILHLSWMKICFCISRGREHSGYRDTGRGKGR